MGKPSGGGSTPTTMFTLNKSGSGSSGLELWIDLGLIPTGKDMWIGSTQYTTAKSTTFELRTNIATKFAAVLAETTLLNTQALTARSKTVTTDLYKAGALHIKTVTSGGVEHWWLRLKSTSATLGTYNYKINFLEE